MKLITAAWLFLLLMSSCGEPTSPARIGDFQVELRIHRMDGGSGTALVSNGIPLPPGVLAASAGTNISSQVRLLINGHPQPIYAEALYGFHAVDGSRRSILVQTTQTVGDGAPIDAVLEFGSNSATQAKQPVPVPLAQAVALPTSAEYLISTDLVGPTVPVAAMRSGSPREEYDDYFAQGSDTHDPVWGDIRYDASWSHYARWARDPNPLWWRRATVEAVRYRQAWLEPGPGGWSMIQRFQPDGLFTHYLLTGDEASRYQLSRYADWSAAWWTPARNYSFHFRARGESGYREGRQQQRVLLGHIYSWLLEDTQRSWLKLSDDFVQSWIDTQEPHYANAVHGITQTWPSGSLDGSWYYALGHYDDCTSLDPPQADDTCAFGQSNYMEALRLYAMIQYYRLRSPSAAMKAAIAQSIKAQVDFVWSTQWMGDPPGFHYWSHPRGDLSGPGVPPSLTPGLSNLYVAGFGFVYHTTGDPVYRDRATLLMTRSLRYAASNGAFTSTPLWAQRLVVQQFYSSWHHFAWEVE